MKIVERKGRQYRLPAGLNEFQQEMYIHLIDWKWKYRTLEPGYYRGNPYDALLPDSLREKLVLIHPSVVDDFNSHWERFQFKKHKFINHIASSQIACVNLFLPLFRYPGKAAQVLQAVKPDLQEIAVNQFDSGFQLEFWDDRDKSLNDHTQAAGTEADIAIAYYSKIGDLDLWLIEHKLTEHEFTTCGGYRSHGRKPRHRCDSITEILRNKQLCYYANVSDYRYWDVTIDNEQMFPRKNLLEFGTCPFQGGLNQLWRNQLLGLAIENSTSGKWNFKRVYFSVVHHLKNRHLEASMNLYRKLMGLNDRFFSFTSDLLINRAKQLNFSPRENWLTWYEDLYYF